MQFHDFDNKTNKKLKTKEDNLIQWHTPEGDITTNMIVKIDSTIHEFSAKKL